MNGAEPSFVSSVKVWDKSEGVEKSTFRACLYLEFFFTLQFHELARTKIPITTIVAVQRQMS